MLDRGLRSATAVRSVGCGVVVVMLVLTGVAGGQAPVGHTLRHARARKGALAPVTFTFSGHEEMYTVPAGVTSLEVEAVGANGANSLGPSPALGGTGGTVVGGLAVGEDAAITPGDTVYVAVGETFRGDRLGGFNGGGDGGGIFPGGTGRGGGGATDLRTCSRAATSCPNGDPSALTRLIVAGGGGGAGGCTHQSDCDLFAEAGGDAGRRGDGLPGTGGGGGTLDGPGAGGGGRLASGTAGGVDGTGGEGATQPNGGLGKLGGGGGGGGYTGGGGGGIGITSDGSAYIAAGGGGGANFASPLASNVTFGLGDGHARLVITPRPASAIRVSRILYNSPGPDTATNKSLNTEFVRLKNVSRTVRQLRGWTISDSHGRVYRFGGLRLAPGASVTVHSGHGRDTGRDRFWNRRDYVWDNAGDLARVRTPQGRLADQCRYDNARASQLRC